MDGRPVVPAPHGTHNASGSGLLPADRKKQGMFTFQSIMFNISAGHLPLLSKLRVWVDRARKRVVAHVSGLGSR